jgi:hypothetical protein
MTTRLPASTRSGKLRDRRGVESGVARAKDFRF